MAVPRFRVAERQVMMLLLVVSVIGFVGAFFLGGFRQRGQSLDRTGAPRVVWMPAAGQTPASGPQYLIADYFDPSLMSLPSVHGFSQRMWLRSAGAAPRTFEPPAELALLNPAATTELATLLPESPLADQLHSVVEKLPATADDVATDEPTVAAAIATQSTLRVEGTLEQRELLQFPGLPVVLAEAGLRPTRVRVAVAPDGRVRYWALDLTCGNETVDAQALDIANRLRFEPATSTDPLALTWGVVNFYWATK